MVVRAVLARGGLQEGPLPDRRKRRPSRLSAGSGGAAGPAGPGAPSIEWAMVPIALGALAWFAYSVGVMHLTFPPWPDEALFADVSKNLLHHGRMSTDLYGEFFPAMKERYYLTPPLYHVAVAGWFAVFGSGLAAMRFFSVLVAGGIFALVYALARRIGLSRAMALAPVSFLALDGVFLRASLVGRMDLPALFFILLALWIALGGEPGVSSDRRRLRPSQRSFLLGLVCALAVLTHPIGLVAAAICVGRAAAAAVSATSRRGDSPGPKGAAPRPVRDTLLPMLAGLAVGLLPWVLFALRDLPAFAEQMGGQLTRKSVRDWWGMGLPLALEQWDVNGRLVVTAWICGVAGLAIRAVRQPGCRLLLAAQVLITLVVLAGCEMWYPVYVLPLTAVGIACALGGVKGAAVWQRGAGVAIAVLAAWFLQQNAVRISAIREPRGLSVRADAGYFEWCRGISEFLPENSTVLLNLLPTPYFGLAERGGLALRFFPPEGFKVREGRYRPALERMDYIIGGRTLLDPEVREFVLAHGEIVGQIGERLGPGYYAAIVKVHE